MSRRGFAKIELAAYAADLAATGAIHALVLVLGLGPKLVWLFTSNAGGWSAFFGLLFAAAFGAWLVFFQWSEEFGNWLEWKGVEAIYSRVFLFHIAVFALGTAVMLPTSITHKAVLNSVQLFIAILAALNVFTLALLTYQLLRLKSMFRMKLRKSGEA